MKEVTKHIPVLFTETLHGLNLSPGKIVVDATLGGGGHASAILREVLPEGRVIALDTDREAIERFVQGKDKKSVEKAALIDKSLVLVHGNYSELGVILDKESIQKVDAILADLGFSSDQIESSARGFSFQEEGPLDMRLNQEGELTAEMIINTFSSKEIESILRTYGDEQVGGRIAEAIVASRDEAPIRTTIELATLIGTVYPKGLRYRSKIHPATKTFQALRIFVNQEFVHLEKFLTQAVDRLAKGGRLAIITFHSGEDKRVKHFFKEQAVGCVCPPNFPVCRCNRKSVIKILTKKSIVAGEEEQKKNPRSRSAKLRIIEKV